MLLIPLKYLGFSNFPIIKRGNFSLQSLFALTNPVMYSFDLLTPLQVFPLKVMVLLGSNLQKIPVSSVLKYLLGGSSALTWVEHLHSIGLQLLGQQTYSHCKIPVSSVLKYLLGGSSALTWVEHLHSIGLQLLGQQTYSHCKCAYKQYCGIIKSILPFCPAMPSLYTHTV